MTHVYLPERITDQQLDELLTTSSQPPKTAQPVAEPDNQPQGDGTFWLGSLQHPLYRLRRTIPLELSQEGDEVVVTWAAANSLFGYGANLAEAVRDFLAALVDLYESICEADLAPSAESTRTLLQAHIGTQTR